ncbi:hypothetical protein E3N88_20624 [Mikania micrantha]|uniref:CCHC-type domain-containing protein n=1 Tax=Mikania micrantha TaxID=192012 RepID=A0A5N6NHJ2_9ASTR|nr:hypothetical protein E3N88_20624 [Mikania micrantha]
MAKLAGLGKDNTKAENVFSVCGGCGEIGHKASQCSAQFGPTEEVNQVYGDMNSNTYHPGCVTIRTSGNYRQQQPPQKGNQQGGSTSTSEASKIDEIFEMLKEMKKENEMRDKAFNALNKQVGQMAEDLAKRNPGTLPSDTKVNPAHQGSSSKHAQVKQVTTLRNGKVYDNKVDVPPTFVEGVVEDVDEDE